MYGYQPTINQEFILERYSQEVIFKTLLNAEIVTGKSNLYFAPYRIDKKAGCYFQYYNNILFFIDFANTPTHFTCFQLWSIMYDIDLSLVPEAIFYSIKAQKITKTQAQKKLNNNRVSLPKKDTKITIIDKPFNLEDKKYWQQYGITSKQLIEDKVLSVLAFKIESTKIFCQRPYKICYAYTNFENNKKKIYQPYANKSDKWFTNCGKNDIGKVNNINIPDQQSILIITKSYKDCRVLSNFGFTSIWFQNEGMFPDDEILYPILKQFDSSIIFFDNDARGISASAALKQKIQKLELKTDFIMLPESLLNQSIKDISDLYAAKGQSEVQQFLNKIKK